jgi:hypothetical protein
MRFQVWNGSRIVRRTGQARPAGNGDASLLAMDCAPRQTVNATRLHMASDTGTVPHNGKLLL